MSRTALLFLVVALSGCITERRASFSSPPGPLPFTNALQAQPLERSWAVGEIFVSAEQQGPQQPADNWAKARAQIEERLEQTLLRQNGLGQRTDDRQSAELIVDVDVRIHEARALNGWVAPAILSEVAILGVGAGTGAGVGYAVGRNDTPDSAVIGSLVGMGLAIVPAVIVPLLFPATDVVGGADAKLTFRRASDGVVIFEKRTRSEWVRQANSFSVEDKLAEITGAGTEELEKQLVVALYAGLKASPSTGQLAGSRLEPESGILLSDAPRLLQRPQ